MKNTALNIVIIIGLIAMGYFIRFFMTPKPGIEYIEKQVAIADTSMHKKFRSEIALLNNLVYELDNPILLQKPKNKKPLTLEMLEGKLKGAFGKLKSKPKNIYPKGEFHLLEAFKFDRKDFKLALGDSLSCVVNMELSAIVYTDTLGNLYEDHIIETWLSGILFSTQLDLPKKWKRFFMLNGGWDFKNKYPVIGIGFGYTYREVVGVHLYGESNTCLELGIHGNF